MPGGYWGGLVEGFQGRRESELKENYDREVQNRQLADRVFSHLLASRDPEMQQLALSGLLQPINKKKGFRGFLGEVDSTDPIIQQIVARSNEMVGDEGPATPNPPTAPTPPPEPPGSAAMSTNQSVRPGAAPINAPPAPLAGGGMGPQDLTQIPNAPPEPPAAALGPQGGPAAGLMPPPPPPEHPLHRRGTGVPTAEEIAEMNARIPVQAKIKVATEELTRAGATPEEIQHTIMGMLGAPQNQRQFATPTYAVEDPSHANAPVPVSFDYSTGKFFFTDGTPVPRGAKFVRMSGGGSTAGLSSYVQDTPDQRQQLQTQYPDLELPPGISPTGYLKIQIRPDGSAMAIPSEFTPPPAYAGTTVIPDPNNPQVPTRVPILRQGGTGPALGDEPSPVKSQSQLDAEGLLAAVDDEVKLQTSSNLLKKSPTPQQRDQIVRQKSQAQGLPYQTYDDLVRAAKSATPVTARERATGGTMAERVRARALANRGQQEARPPIKPALPPASPPPTAPARARGAGPVGQ